MTINDLFGVEIISSGLDFTGQTIEPKGSISISGMGMDINQFIDSNVKLYNTDYDDLQFEYEIETIVYDEKQDSEEISTEERNDINKSQGKDDKNGDENNTASNETKAMTMEEAATFLNGTWNKSTGGSVYIITADASGNMTFNFNGYQSTGTFSVSGSTITFVGNFSSGTYNFTLTETIQVKDDKTALFSSTMTSVEFPDNPATTNPAEEYVKN